jgi:Icc-related predicted phosphoesterase
MKILFATDLHGNRRAYTQLFEEAPERGADALVLGGDMLPKKGFVRDTLSGQRAFIRQWLRPEVEGFRAANPDTRLFWMFGNDDWAVNRDLLEEMEREGLAEWIHGRALRLTADLWLGGYAFVPLTPFGIKDWDKYDTDRQRPPVQWSPPVMSGPEGRIPVDLERDVRVRGTIAEDLDKLAALSPPGRTIYSFHTPPAETRLDLTFQRRHAGSPALRAWLLREQPPVTLHGHIHESPRMSGAITDRLGATLAINPGSSERTLRAILFDTDDPDGSLERFGAGWR